MNRVKLLLDLCEVTKPEDLTYELTSGSLETIEFLAKKLKAQRIPYIIKDITTNQAYDTEINGKSVVRLQPGYKEDTFKLLVSKHDYDKANKVLKK